ncbi:hypothetical protein KKA69_03780 [Patescibacteria group bacterium]|nr:hypothetical protein [Patescibacteria group bacterium]
MKKNIMVSILIVFLLILAGLLFYAKTNKKVPSISLPFEETKQEEPASQLVSPTPILPKEVAEIEEDLNMIEADINKIKEDSRLNPPTFIFSLGISQ